MQFLKTTGQVMLCALIAAGVGGIGGSIALSISPILVEMTGDKITLGGLLFALPLALAIGGFFGIFFGSIFGMILGFIPSFAAGWTLVQLSRWKPFQSVFIWALCGGLVGFAVAMLFPGHKVFSSKSAWVGGGVTAMITFWGLGYRTFQLRPLTLSFHRQR